MVLKPPPEDDWFAEAAREVSETPLAKTLREAADAVARSKRIRQETELLAAAAKEAERIRARPSAAAASSAAASFGVTPPGTPSPPPWVPRPRTTSGRRSEPERGNFNSANPFAADNPENGLLAITAAVRRAADPNDPDAVLKAAGEWITKITNAITQVVKDADEENDE